MDTTLGVNGRATPLVTTKDKKFGGIFQPSIVANFNYFSFKMRRPSLAVARAGDRPGGRAGAASDGK